MLDDVDIRVDFFESVLRAVNFGFADGTLAMHNLPLQVGHVHGVKIHKPNRADARRRQVHRQRCAEATGADAQHFGGFQPLLPFHRHFRHNQMPRITQHFVVRQRLGIRVACQVERRRSAGPDGVQTARNARHDGQHVAVLNRRRTALQVPAVFVVDVDIDKRA